MRIDDVGNDEQFWTTLIEDSVTKGYGTTIVPVAGLSQQAAINLATKLQVSLLVKDMDYLFSRDKEGTLVQMGERVERH